MTSVVLGHFPLAVIGIIIFGFPDLNGLNYILISAFLHFFYQIFLLNAYKYGELSEVYPIARGASPLIITSVSICFLKDNISFFEILGIIIISFSILIYGLKQYLDNKSNIRGFYLALITGCFIASYSLVDGFGARVTQNPISYYSVVTLVNGIIFTIFIKFYHPGILRRVAHEGKKSFFIGGAASYTAYAIVVWACLFLPIAVVSSIRETSIIFALLLGIYCLKEKFNLIKFILIAGSFFGIVLMRIG
ncbi:MAG: EamA family transporter [Proteobacteria bacterium]|jgi:drug/metabolite transporter (DMT)-like permease|nr:EamA family transporter [Pseudomonadota bacterium]MDA1134839.1 EamA family transporter [Pseudomonadota bacterium]|tara:strand:- start:1773 stop:2519 length:747 start_codon:yes stop_codon:yes gene_type:complete